MKYVNLALVGCGDFMVHAHVPQLLQVPEIRVVALCDSRPGVAEKLRVQQFHDDPKIRIYAKWEQLLKNRPQGLCGVLFATPHHQHFEQCSAALQQGWNVLVEKPMVTNSTHARALAELVEKSGLQLQIAFQAPFSAEYGFIKELLNRGALGELQTVAGMCHQAWKSSTWDTWRQKPELSGGGFIYDTASHLLNAITWLVDRPALEVFAWLDNKLTSVEINGTISIRWEKYLIGSVTASGNSPGWQEGIWLAGDKGRVVTGIHGGRLEYFDRDGGLVSHVRPKDHHQTPVQNFALSLLGRQEPRCPVRFGVLNSQLMDSIYQSAREGRPVNVGEIS